jgi:dTDP-4-amino-4,6-dideoxygalactose transaminase
VRPGYIPFNRPYVAGPEIDYLRESIDNLHVSGAGPFSARCSEWLERETGCARALLTPSCTAALEMAVLLADIQPGDEVIMPSFTFVSCANAVVLRGGVPVFVDVRKDTLNLDERLLERAVTPRTRAIVPTHYAGIGCEMSAILEVARAHGLLVFEDAAQGILASYQGRPLGSIGDAGALSFHETKNVMCGEGGALLVNDERWVERAEIIHEKGTNRRKFFRGQVDKYSWVDVGSSYPLSDVNASFLWAQLEASRRINEDRFETWNAYHDAFAALEASERARRPIVPDDRAHNAHIYYLLLGDGIERDSFIGSLDEAGVQAVFHYVPLHSSVAGQRFGRTSGSLGVTDWVAERLVRLPLWTGMTPVERSRVVDAVHEALVDVPSAAAGRPA